jgi:hypothetical protein
MNVVLHMIIIFTSTRWFDPCMVACMAVRILVREVEVGTILRGPIVSGWSCLSVSLVEQLRREYSLVSTEDLTTRFLILIGNSSTSRMLITNILRVLRPQVIEPVVLNGLPSSYSLIRIHLEHLPHQVYLNFIHDSSIPGLNRLWIRDLREFKSLISGIPIKFILEKIWKRSQNFLNNEKLINFWITWEKWLTIH